MGEFKQLREFSPDELVLTKEQAVVVLKFIFDKAHHATIDRVASTRDIRGFAQGLLVEAIDASYKMGFVEGIFRASANPSKGAVAVMKDFAKRAAKHWFKHATAKDLYDVKIYEAVAHKLAASFKSTLYDYLAKGPAPAKPGAAVAHAVPIGSKPVTIG